MNLEELSNTADCIVTKNPPSFYYDSGLESEEDTKNPVDLTIDHVCFISYLELIYDDIIYHRGDRVERYYCNAYTEIKEHNFKMDFKFILYKNTVNNTFYTETDPGNRSPKIPRGHRWYIKLLFLRRFNENDLL